MVGTGDDPQGNRSPLVQPPRRAGAQMVAQGRLHGGAPQLRAPTRSVRVRGRPADRWRSSRTVRDRRTLRPRPRSTETRSAPDRRPVPGRRLTGTTRPAAKGWPCRRRSGDPPTTATKVGLRQRSVGPRAVISRVHGADRIADQFIGQLERVGIGRAGRRDPERGQPSPPPVLQHGPQAGLVDFEHGSRPWGWRLGEAARTVAPSRRPPCFVAGRPGRLHEAHAVAGGQAGVRRLPRREERHVRVTDELPSPGRRRRIDAGVPVGQRDRPGRHGGAGAGPARHLAQRGGQAGEIGEAGREPDDGHREWLQRSSSPPRPRACAPRASPPPPGPAHRRCRGSRGALRHRPPGPLPRPRPAGRRPPPVRCASRGRAVVDISGRRIEGHHDRGQPAHHFGHAPRAGLR